MHDCAQDGLGLAAGSGHGSAFRSRPPWRGVLILRDKIVKVAVSAISHVTKDVHAASKPKGGCFSLMSFVRGCNNALKTHRYRPKAWLAPECDLGHIAPGGADLPSHHGQGEMRRPGETEMARITTLCHTAWTGAQSTAIFMLCIGTGLAFPVAAFAVGLQAL